MYSAGEVSVNRACCERAIQPYSLGRGGVRFLQARDQQVTIRSLRIVTECFLTRSMYIYVFTVDFVHLLSLSDYINMINLLPVSSVNLHGLASTNIFHNNLRVMLSLLKSPVLHKYSNPFK